MEELASGYDYGVRMAGIKVLALAEAHHPTEQARTSCLDGCGHWWQVTASCRSTKFPPDCQTMHVILTPQLGK